MAAVIPNDLSFTPLDILTAAEMNKLIENDNYLANYCNDIDARIDGLMNLIYPVGSFFKTADLTFNPNTEFGGTWVEDTDYVLVAYASTNNGTTIVSSKNISGVTRNDTGAYRVSFSKPMANTNYIVHVNSEANGSGSELAGVYGRTTTQFTLDFTNHSGSASDQTNIYISVFGQLANKEYKTWKRIA